MSDPLLHDRLATTSETGKRVYLYPQWVNGFWTKRKSIIHGLLVFLFLLIPWIKIKGHPLLLLDVIHRKFSVFGIQFWATDFPLVVLIFLIFAITISLVTSYMGRVWCGWSCPQTVYVEAIFRKIERWIEGDGVARKKLDAGPYNLEKFFKKISKWFLFLTVSWFISHAFLAYFIGPQQIIELFRHSPSENWVTFKAVCFFTAIVVFDFGWFREQFCVIMCPYGRFQSVMMDPQSLVIYYDEKRGEPRRSGGDCIDCNKCVNVCPTGIDIRRGVQLECVACTSCIDACDSVMAKLKKPLGLIRYDSMAGDGKRVFFKPRMFIYISLLLLSIATLTAILHTRKNIEVTLLRAKDTPYRILEGATRPIINHFKLVLHNRRFEDIAVTFESQDKRVQISSPIQGLLLKTGEERHFDFFITFPAEILSEGRGSSKIVIESNTQDEHAHHEFQNEELTLVGPF